MTNQSSPPPSTASRLHSTLAGFVLVLQIGVLLPLLIFTSNSDEFLLGFSQYLGTTGTLLIITFLAFATAPAVLPQTGRLLVLAFYSALGFASYLQSNFINRNYGVLDGTPISWDTFHIEYITDVAVWGLLIVGALFWFRTLGRHALKILTCIFVLQSVSSVPYVVRAPAGWFFAEQATNTQRVSQFSSNSNVVVILLDAFSGVTFRDLLEKDKQIPTEFSDFIYFRDTLSDFPSTFLSIPSILTGHPFDSSTNIGTYFSDTFANKNLPFLLEQQGYQSDIVTLKSFCHFYRGENCVGFTMSARDGSETARRSEAYELLGVALFRAGPQALKERLYRNGHWTLPRLFSARKDPQSKYERNVAFVDELVSKSTAGVTKPTFKFFHLLVPHLPVRLNSDCQMYNPPPGRMNLAVGAQSQCALLLAQKIIGRMKDLKIYDNSMIVVMSDHGDHVQRARSKNLEKSGLDIRPVVHSPLLLIKPPHYTAPFEERTTQALVSDVAKTITSTLGIATEIPGLALLQEPQSNTRSRRVRKIPLRWNMWKQGVADSAMESMPAFDVTGDGSRIESWHALADSQIKDK